MDWSGTACTLPDNTILINLTFQYSGGSTPLAWYDDGASCSYVISGTAPFYYDQPSDIFYINGYIGADPLIADFSASNVNPPINTTIALTDATAGNPTGWSWSISPESFVFMDGSDESSQNPQLQFTEGGTYSVVLIAYRGTASSIRIRNDYITVSSSQPSLSGTVFDDSDRMTDNTVDGTGTSASGSLYANLLNTGNIVVATVAVNTDGTFKFQNMISGTLTIQVSIHQGTVGLSMPATELPFPWINTGEHLGAGAGSDGTADGLLTVVADGVNDITNANFGIVKVPDVTPIITVAPNVMLGITSFTITVRSSEINNVPTEGLITVRITKDTRWVIAGSFSDPVWSYSGTDPNYHVFTTSSPIAPGGYSTFVINASWNAGQTTGIYTITSQMDSHSGGEVRVNNNVDAERIDYFIN